MKVLTDLILVLAVSTYAYLIFLRWAIRRVQERTTTLLDRVDDLTSRYSLGETRDVTELRKLVMTGAALAAYLVFETEIRVFQWLTRRAKRAEGSEPYVPEKLWDDFDTEFLEIGHRAGLDFFLLQVLGNPSSLKAWANFLHHQRQHSSIPWPEIRGKAFEHVAGTVPHPGAASDHSTAKPNAYGLDVKGEFTDLVACRHRFA